MGERGPKSAEELMVTASSAALVQRMEPPDELWRDEECAVWRQVVEALPADWFSPADAPLLVQYCRHVVQARRVAQLIRQMEHTSAPLDLDAWTRLMRAQDAQSAAVARLATKMRLSQQSRYGARAAHTAARRGTRGKAPWET